MTSAGTGGARRAAAGAAAIGENRRQGRAEGGGCASIQPQNEYF
jgi:hypothetical protein